jgi:hypothetical protein
MQNLSVENLQDQSKFEKLIEINMQDVVSFVRRYYYQNITWVIVSHYLSTFLVLAFWIWTGIMNKLNVDQWLTSFGYSVFAFFVLLPIHEGIHGLAYRMVGAKDIRYGYSLRKFYAYAIAPNYVVNARQFFWVAILPFGVINSALIVLAILFPAWTMYFLATLLLHIGGTSGDFSLLNFVWIHRQRELYTYDDAETKTSYFYAKLRN